VHEQHVAALPAQMQHERTAGANRELLASENHGRPAIAATAKPGEFTGRGVIAAREPAAREEHSPVTNGAARPSDKPLEKEEGRRPQQTLREEAPKAKGPEERPAHEQAKLPGEKPLEKEQGRRPQETLKEEAPKAKGSEERPAHEQAKLPGEKPLEKEQSHRPQETLKEEGPKAKRPDERPAHEQAKLPSDRPETLNAHERPSEAPNAAAHQPTPHAAAEPATHANPKQSPKEKKPPE
jgi:hypothetical protein